MASNSKKSLLMLTVSMVIFGSIGVFRRYIPLSSSALACFRGLSGALFLLVAAKIRKKRIFRRIGAEKTILLIFSGAAIGLNWILLFEAYHYTTVATATLCYYMEPTIVVLLSPLIFKEAIALKKWVCVVLSIVGMVFVSGFVEGGIPPLSEAKGILFGIGAAIVYAAVVIMNKLLSGLDAYEKTFIQLLSAAVILVPYILISRQSFQIEWNATVVVILLIVGVVHTGVAYTLYFGSMDGVKTQTVALLSYLDPITALLLSAVILKERMTFFGIAGAILIIGAALIGEIDFKKKR